MLWSWRSLSGLRWVWRNGRGPHLEGRQEPQASSPFRTPTLRPQVPAELGQESQASSCLRKGIPIASRGAQGVLGPSSAVCGTCGCFRTMHGDVSAPSCCAFPHSVAFEEVSGHRVLLKSGRGNRGRWACGTTHVARLEFPPETGIILSCVGKAGNPFQTMQGNRLSCRD